MCKRKYYYNNRYMTMYAKFTELLQIHTSMSSPPMGNATPGGKSPGM